MGLWILNLVKAPRRLLALPAPVIFKSVGLVIALTVLVCGCTLRSTERAAAKTVSGIGKLATTTTVAVVKTSGQVTVATAKAVVTTSGSIAKGVAATAFVTFKNSATGISQQIPYREGLRLYAASQTAKIEGAIASFELLRNGVAVMHAKWSSVKAGSHTDPVLSAGDVVRLSQPKPVGQKSSRSGGGEEISPSGG